jgi:chromosome segregation ATPase
LFLLVQGLAAHLSAKKSALERLDGYRLRLRKTEEDLRHKEDERRVVAETLKKANAENKVFSGDNKSLRADLEAANKRDAERDQQLALAEEKIKSLEARLVSAEAAAATLVSATESAK